MSANHEFPLLNRDFHPGSEQYKAIASMPPKFLGSGIAGES
jgi:hypothetical protein